MRRPFLRAVLVALIAASSSTPAIAFHDPFDVEGAIEESAAMSESGDPDWWLDSGARLVRRNGFAMTLLGRLDSGDRWRRAYAESNPVDTENGFRPQNLFRLVARGEWREFRQQVHFRIRRANRTDSPNRGAWNGVLLLERYRDDDNLYYAGLRVDGVAVIKKKRFGGYTELARRALYPGDYDRSRDRSLLPEMEWIGVRTVTTTPVDGGVRIELSVDDPRLGAGWTPVLEAEDRGAGGAPPIGRAGHAGIRADFLDVQFDDYFAIEE